MNPSPRPPATTSDQRKQSAARQTPSVMLAAKPQWVWGTLVAILLFACAVAGFSMWVILHYHPK